MKTPEELIEWLWLNTQISIYNIEECRDIISYLGAFEQIRWERDIAIGQLHELGYELGEKTKEKKLKMITSTVDRAKSNAVLDGRLDEELAPIYRLIESARDQGEKDIFIDEFLKSELSNRLRNLGYKVTTYADPIHEWSHISWH